MEAKEAIFSEDQSGKSADLTNQNQQTEMETDTAQFQGENGDVTKNNEEIESLKAALEKSQAELNEQKDKYLRLYADLDNTKRRFAKERIDLIQTAGKDIITDLLVVLDDSERAEKELNQSEDIEQIRKGVHLGFQKFRNILQGKGLKVMECKGTDFDPDMHEAIAEIPAPNADAAGKIIDIAENGFLLGDKIIRYAKVVVGK
ncbi:MAG: nucleotide exchange factor GrpE [Chitinophagaceae bacterium]